MTTLGTSLLASGALYGVALFAAGFLFGTLRELAMAPLLGRGSATVVEFAIMLIATILIAAWLVLRREAHAGRLRLAMVGALGVVVLLIFESGLALGVLGIPLAKYLEGFDITKGSLFPFGLLLAWLAPLLVRPTACVMPSDRPRSD